MVIVQPVSFMIETLRVVFGLPPKISRSRNVARIF
jgi:hypothetical protein